MVNTEAKFVRAGGTEIHYVEAGAGEPLLLLHGGMMSTNAVWAGHPGSYVSHMDRFAADFRVIALDTRGHGRTPNPGHAPIDYDRLADDVLGVIEALALDRPLVCGFSEGGMTATVLTMRAPSSVRALVNDAGFDLLDPQSPSFGMMRQMLGGSPDATTADPDALERFFAAHGGMFGFVERMKADHDGARGIGTWRTIVAEAFDRLVTPRYTFDDLRRVTAPSLILTGDRDMCCSVEQAVTAFRSLATAELAILPDEGHYVSEAAIRTTLEFLRRHRG